MLKNLSTTYDLKSAAKEYAFLAMLLPVVTSIAFSDAFAYTQGIPP